MTYQTPELLLVGAAEGIVLGELSVPADFKDTASNQLSRNIPL